MEYSGSYFSADHISIRTSSNIREIVAPLFTRFQADYFNFIRKFDYGKEFVLTTDPGWLDYFFTNAFDKRTVLDKRVEKLVSGLQQQLIIPWTEVSDSYILGEQRKLSGILQGITFIFINPTYTDFFYIGSKLSDPSLSDFYRSNTDLLKRFCLYFSDKATPLIKKAKDPRNLIQTYQPCTTQDAKNVLAKNLEDFDVFLQETQPKKLRFVLPNTNADIALTYREMLCIKGVHAGKSAKEIAKELGLSDRTVEARLEKVRYKLNVNSRLEIIKLFADFDFKTIL